MEILRNKSFAELRSLPEVEIENIEVLGKPVKLSVYRGSQVDGSLLILVRSDTPIFFNLVSTGATEGFLATPDGEKRDARGDQIADFFA